MPAVGALVLAAGTAQAGLAAAPAIFTTAVGTGIVAGAGAYGYGATKKMMSPGGMKFPGDLFKTGLPKTTIGEIEAQEEGWAGILMRARGRRATILTDPQLGEVSPYIKRATLLAG